MQLLHFSVVLYLPVFPSWRPQMWELLKKQKDDPGNSNRLKLGLEHAYSMK